MSEWTGRLSLCWHIVRLLGVDAILAGVARPAAITVVDAFVRLKPTMRENVSRHDSVNDLPPRRTANSATPEDDVVNNSSLLRRTRDYESSMTRWYVCAEFPHCRFQKQTLALTPAKCYPGFNDAMRIANSFVPSHPPPGPVLCDLAAWLRAPRPYVYLNRYPDCVV
ncbi:hypothetical protein LX32DRAFT_351171 [Colletotrichum zoysiae]|uniref:Uncharacterized protein n=1 Tax=Colletotrichum zoysiae TaxID=1216348 RepID=A0AAD9HJV2_9PEZI|nr:hypothetical protein LX32DRAFT_351171 [Colletotrichum zoysiae]